MANPFRCKFNSHCQRCRAFVKKDENMYADDGEFICEECASDNDNICECGSYKKQQYDTCYSCRFEKVKHTYCKSPIVSWAHTVLSEYSGKKVTSESSADELKSAFRIAAKKTHPDTGGNAELFKLVKKAYDILSI